MFSFKNIKIISKSHYFNSLLTSNIRNKIRGFHTNLSVMSNQSTISYKNVFQSHEETLVPEVVKLREDQKIPAWLHGDFMFTGGGIFDIKDFTVNLATDALAILGRFRIRGDSISFEKRILESEAYKKAMLAGKTVLPEYGTKSSADPTRGYLSRFSLGQPEVSDNANHSIFQLDGDQLYVSNGQSYFFSVDQETLEIKTRYETKKLFSLQSYAGHPHVDKDGSIYNIGVEAGASTGARHVIIRHPAGNDPELPFENAEIISRVPNSKPLFLSSCTSLGVTPNFLVVIEAPVFLNLAKYISYIFTGGCYSLLDLADYFPDFKNKFYLIEKSTGRVIKSNITSENSFVYLHYINCFEDDDGFLVIDMVTAPNINAAFGATVENFRSDTPVSEIQDQGAIQRFRIPLQPVLDFDDHQSKEDNNSRSNEGLVPPEIILSPDTISERGIACVCPNRNIITRPYRFCYGNGNVTQGMYANSIIKFDLQTKKSLHWKEEHCLPNEATFVPNPEGHEEDDGILICGVCDTRQDHPHYLLLLRAQDMTEITRVHFNTKVPMHLHGIHIPSA